MIKDAMFRNNNETRLYASRVFVKLGHFFHSVRFNLIGTFGYISLATGGHAGSRRGGSQLFGRGRVNMVRLPAAEFIGGYQDFVGMAHISLIPVVAVVNNTVDMLIRHFVQPFLVNFVFHCIFNR